MIVPANPKLLRYIPKSVLQNPFELLLGIMCTFSGVPYLLGNRPNSKIEANIPPLLIRLWGFNLAVGGIFLIWGLVRNSSLVERAGLSMLGPTAYAYAVMLIAYVGYPSLFSACLIIAFGTACLLRDYTVKVATVAINRVFRELDGDV